MYITVVKPAPLYGLVNMGRIKECGGTCVHYSGETSTAVRAGEEGTYKGMWMSHKSKRCD